jgi:hypothetical protein
MPRRDNQGLQIAMIVFVITTLVFLVTTYLFWSQTQKLTAERDQLQQARSDAEQSLRTSASQNVELKQFLGFPPEEEFQAMKSVLEEAQQTYAQGLPPEQQNFRDIAAQLTSRIQGLTKSLSDANQRLQEVTAERDQARQEEEKIVTDARQTASQAVDDLESERNAYQQAREKLNSQLAEMDKQLNAKQRELTTLTAETDKQLQEVRELIAQKEQLLMMRNEQIRRMTGESFASVDGSVTAAVASAGIVWLDVGSDDGLRPRTTFSVYDQGSLNLAAAKPKGSIEVTSILGPHAAEARILDAERNYTNPIVPGDFIYSPVWTRGSRLGFALLGKMDIDGDGTDDRQQVKNLIGQSGGKVDAEDADGRVQGEITVETRYLVRGDTSLGSSDSANQAVKPMLDAADQLGVEQMSLDKFLEAIGYTGRVRTVASGRAAPAATARPAETDRMRAQSPGRTIYSQP